jgi:hypothetical protein
MELKYGDEHDNVQMIHDVIQRVDKFGKRVRELIETSKEDKMGS